MALMDEFEESLQFLIYSSFQLQCCGVFDPKDWDTLLNVPEGNDTSKLYVPNSCCAGFNDDSQECVFYYTSGCLNRMVFVISQSATLIATGATTVAFVQVVSHFQSYISY